MTFLDIIYWILLLSVIVFSAIYGYGLLAGLEKDPIRNLTLKNPSGAKALGIYALIATVLVFFGTIMRFSTA